MEEFRNYLQENKYALNTSNAYSSAINTISSHMSELRGDYINIYQIYDINRLEEIRDTYGLHGNYSEFGNRGNGTVRNAINRFVEFRISQETNNEYSKAEYLNEDDVIHNEFDNQEFSNSIETNQQKILSSLESLHKRFDNQQQEIQTNRNRTTLVIIGIVIILAILIFV